MPETANPSHTRSISRTVLALVGLLFPLAISCTNSSCSDLIIFQVTSGSMAPAHWGPTREVVCQSCGRTWPVCAETVSPGHPGECDICGGMVQISSQVRAGDIVEGRRAPASYSPKRFDCVVFETKLTTEEPPVGHGGPARSSSPASDSSPPGSSNPESSATQWNCKRIWGLPGELLLIERGELYVDGRLFQKSYEQLRRLAVLVSQFDVQSAVSSATSWRIVDSQPANVILALDRERTTLVPGQTLQFHHKSPFDRQRQAVYDDYAQNFSTPRNLAMVDDLLFDFQLQFSAEQLDQEPVAINVELSYLNHRFRHQFNPKLLPNSQGNMDDLRCNFTVAAWDNVVAVVQSGDIENGSQNESQNESRNESQSETQEKRNNSQVERNNSRSTDGQLSQDAGQSKDVHTRLQPIAETAESGGRTTFELSCSTLCRIIAVRVLRDVYLRMDERDESNRTEKQVTVPQDRYFVLGDNLPISHDSRNGLGTVHRNQIRAVLDSDHFHSNSTRTGR